MVVVRYGFSVEKPSTIFSFSWVQFCTENTSLGLFFSSIADSNSFVFLEAFIKTIESLCSRKLSNLPSIFGTIVNMSFFSTKGSFLAAAQAVNEVIPGMVSISYLLVSFF